LASAFLALFRKAAQVWDEHQPRLDSNGKSTQFATLPEFIFGVRLRTRVADRPKAFQAGIFSSERIRHRRSRVVDARQMKSAERAEEMRSDSRF
jgi:hypothetical protein